MANAEQITNRTVTVGTTQIELSPEQFSPSRRTFYSIINTSTAGQQVSISIGQEAVSGSGIVLTTGGFFSESEDTREITQKQINIVSDAVDATVAVQERIELYRWD